MWFSNNIMPQMSPIKWLYISLLCKFNFILIMFILNSIPLKLKFNKDLYKMKTYWKWYW